MPRTKGPAGGFSGAFIRPWLPPLLLLVLLLLAMGTAQVGATRLLRSEAGVGPGSSGHGFLQLSRLGRADEPSQSPTGSANSVSQGSASSGGGAGGISSTFKPQRVLQQYLTGSELVEEATLAFGIPLANEQAQTGAQNSTDANTSPPAGEESHTHAGSCRCDTDHGVSAI
jgi:hypothetical protein